MRFRSLRIQMIQPCRAHCAWCSTHKKNAKFQELVDSQESKRFHAFYREAIELHQPEEVFVSGGEPLLSEDLPELLESIAVGPKRVHVFCSFQFSRKTMDTVAQLSLPDNVVINHTSIYFEPRRWLMLTGFPFEVYRDNVRRSVSMPVRKRFKFIVNHSQLDEEIRRFQELVRPDESCEISLKVMNDQGNGMVVDAMKATKERVHERVSKLDEVLAEAGWSKQRPKSSLDRIGKVVESGDVSLCPYREEALELRLAFYRGGDGKSVLKYRYCPYFPADFGHKFHIGKDDIRKLGRNYKKGPFRDHCDGCRLLHYEGGKVLDPETD